MAVQVPEINIPNYTSVSTPEITEANPIEVLREAARKLGDQTGGLVKGNVFVAPYVGVIRYTFNLWMPTINDYTDPLFYIWTDTSDRSYPVHFVETSSTEPREDADTIDSANELADRLTELFKQQWVVARISQWISIAQGERG